MLRKPSAALNDTIDARSNKRFDRSGISVPLIVNLDAARQFFPPGQSRRYVASISGMIMSLHNMKRTTLLFLCASLLIAAPNAYSQRKSYSPQIISIESYAGKIDKFVNRNPKVKLVFANVTDATTKAPDKWRMFRSEEERQRADTGYNLNDNANVWLRAGRVAAAYFMFQSPSRDWVHYIDYYFRPDGTLAKIHARLNTFYGRMSVIRRRYYDPRGKLLKGSTEYLALGEQRKKKPGDDFIDEPIPVYKRTRNLPFKNLMKGAT